MRVLILTPSYKPTLGGLETATSVLIEAMRQAGHEVEVLVTSKPSLLQQPSDRHYGLLRALQSAVRADAILVQNATLKALPVALVFRRRTWLQHHSAYTDASSPQSALTRCVRLLRRCWVMHSKGICVSSWLAETLRLKDASVIPNAVLPIAPGTRSGQDEVLPDLLFVGRLDLDKGLDVLLRALALSPLSERRLHVVGEGKDEGWLRRLAVELGVAGRVTWMGRQPPTVLPCLYNSASAVVVPSRHESFGLVAVEAALANARVITSDAENLKMWHAWTEVVPLVPEELARQIVRPREPRRDPDSLAALLNPDNVAEAYEEAFSGGGAF